MNFFKIILLISIFTNFAFASFQEVRIGKIDSFYDDKISRVELRNMLDEIEYLFESTLGINVFDYSNSGKNIDLIHLAPSMLEKRIDRKLKKIDLKKIKIKKSNTYLSSKQKDIKRLKQELKEDNKIANKKVKTLNSYISDVNKQKNIAKNEYARIKKYVSIQQAKLKKEKKTLTKKQRALTRTVNKFNNKVNLQNSYIRDFNRLNNELERMNRNFKKIKGNTIGLQEVTVKTFYKNGNRVKEKSVKNTMQMIEIYGFDSKSELKTILAHEIAHLVGIGHINIKDALMNPILQKNQIQELSLTVDDIKNFRKSF
jgi:hypothetical protein